MGKVLILKSIPECGEERKAKKFLINNFQVTSVLREVSCLVVLLMKEPSALQMNGITQKAKDGFVSPNVIFHRVDSCPRGCRPVRQDQHPAAFSELILVLFGLLRRVRCIQQLHLCTDSLRNFILRDVYLFIQNA